MLICDGTQITYASFCATRYTPIDPPYVSHAEGLALHTAYIEKFWASSVSMYDFLVPEYKPVGAAGGGGREL
jgi:hypothetical protein